MLPRSEYRPRHSRSYKRDSNPVILELLQIVRTVQKSALAGKISFRWRGAVPAVPLQFLTGYVHSYKSGYSGQSFHWPLRR